jgi:hypothetical protein
MEEQPGNWRRRSTISALFMNSSLRTTAWLAWTSRRPRSSKRTAWEYEAFAGPTISGHLSRTACSFVGTPIPCLALRLSISSTSACEGRLRMPRGSSDGIFLSEAIKSSAVLLNLWGSPCISWGQAMPVIDAGGKL